MPKSQSLQRILAPAKEKEKKYDWPKAAWMFRCEAVAKYLGYWVTSDPSERRKLLDACI